MSNFECSKCGKCCSNYLPLKKSEIKELKKRAIKENKLLISNEWYSICPFLNYQHKCDIYENRPLICRSYTCDKYKKHILEGEILQEIMKEQFILTDVRKEIFGKETKICLE